MNTYDKVRRLTSCKVETIRLRWDKVEPAFKAQIELHLKNQVYFLKIEEKGERVYVRV